MEPAASASHDTLGSKVRVIPISSPYHDPDVMEVPSSTWVSSSQSNKRKRSKVVPQDILEIDGDDDLSVVTINGAHNVDKKNKQPLEFGKDFQKQAKPLEYDHLVGSSTYQGQMEDFVVDCSFLDDEYEYGNCIDEGNDYDAIYYNENAADSINWTDGFGDLPSGVEVTAPWLQKLEPEISKAENSSNKMIIPHEIEKTYKLFKQFDTVQDYSDHHYSKGNVAKGSKVGKKPSKDWSKRIQHEWKVLQTDLPDSIFVRAYEERMDLLRAVIIGPAGTPYHDGLFFFDVIFPSNYPRAPPLVHYHSGGLRLNPNLYDCGKVCLSLLGTWSGSGCERWNPEKSTMLQVLVSIQALVLNAKPYFNEPGFACSVNTPGGEKKSLAYNEDTFLLSCKTMLYSLRRPPKNFEDFIYGHFQKHGRNILVACRAYMNGAQVGCVDEQGVQDVDEGDKSCSSAFRTSLKNLYEELLMEFTVKGADSVQFLAQEPLDTTLRL